LLRERRLLRVLRDITQRGVAGKALHCIAAAAVPVGRGARHKGEEGEHEGDTLEHS
jgi:hypothetical protein